MAYQFIHLESWSHKADDKGRSTNFIFDDALHDKRPVAKTSRTCKNGKMTLKAIRKDQNMLAGRIFAHPVRVDGFNTDIRDDVAV